MRKIISSSIILGILFSFAACDDSPETNENENGGGIKNLINAVNFEQPSVEIKYQGRNAYLSIQAKQNDTIINDVIINRGNCPITMAIYMNMFGDKSEKFLEKYPENEMLIFFHEKKSENLSEVRDFVIKLNEEVANIDCVQKWGEKLDFVAAHNLEKYGVLSSLSDDCRSIVSEYAKNHTELLQEPKQPTPGGNIATSYLALNTKDGKKVWALTSSFYNNDESAKKYLNSLDDDSKAFYKMEFPKKLQFGEQYNLGFGFDIHNCRPDSVLEVVLKTNGGDFEYKFDR